MGVADAVLLLANVIYGTTFAATRVVLDAVPPATLALTRLGIAAIVLVPFARSPMRESFSRADHGRLAAMGVVGFAGAVALGHWGLARSTATNAALLIVIEPLTLLVLGPLLLGESLNVRERVGAACAVAGALLVVVNGVPGVNVAVAPHWRGDVLLVLSGMAYAAYSLLARPVLARHRALPVTLASLLWSLPALAPFALAEWLSGRRPAWTLSTVVATVLLGVIATALGFVVWNWALERVTAAHAAIFLNIQPVVGAAVGVAVLGEAWNAFTALGGLLVMAGLTLTVRRAASVAVYSET
jgi:drug/metabolite transporter (DMT)-like permease